MGNLVIGIPNSIYQFTNFPNYQFLLCFPAERATMRARVERLPAVPAETGLRRLARLQPRLDVGGLGIGRGAGGRGTAPDAAASGEDIVQQVAGALVAIDDGRRHRLHDDVVD